MPIKSLLCAVLFVSMLPLSAFALDQPPEERGVPPVTVTQSGANWIIAGKKTTVILNGADLSMNVKSGVTEWKLSPSAENDMTVQAGPALFEMAKLFPVKADSALVKFRFADAPRKEIAPYSTGYSMGVKVTLAGFRMGGNEIPLVMQLFITLETPEEELVCTATPVNEDAYLIKECLWPKGFAPGTTDFSVVPFMQGMLLPDKWPRKVWLYDTMSYGRGLYMPWWGFEKGKSAALVLLETPDDGGCVFEHPEGGPTVLAPRWANSLGKLGYPRTIRMCFMENGNYVDLAKRYRRYIVEAGRFVSLNTKIARTPRVAQLIGSPVVHTGILTHIQPESSYYDKDHPENNHQLVTFDQRMKELQALRSKGVDRAYVHLDGWGFRGYDNLHPDNVPPSPEAGGWEGLKRLADACDRLGYVFALHDQFRDYFYDGPSFDERHTVLDENGSRPVWSVWYGGKQSILCSVFAPEFVKRNHRLLKDHGIKIRGSYLDVFAVVPPDECYNPEHPVTRTDCLRYRAECFSIIKSLEGVVSSEEPADWAMPYLDLTHHGPYALDPNPGKGPSMGIAIPLFNLVYHDVLILPWSMGKGDWGIPETDLGYLHGLMNAGIPYLSLTPDAAELKRVRTMCALHTRLARLEMVKHEFLDSGYRKQRTTYSDGTTVTVDFDKETFEINPVLKMK